MHYQWRPDWPVEVHQFPQSPLVVYVAGFDLLDVEAPQFPALDLRAELAGFLHHLSKGLELPHVLFKREQGL
jgi:hypothetical protein